jgi:hypothetical protein
MRRYRNLDGASGVRAYQLLDDAIAVRFANGVTYLYDDATTGRDAVQHMRRLAAAGRGLATYISQHVQDRYADRIDPTQE